MRTRAAYHQPAPRPSPDCLFLGPVRAVNDHQKGDIRIETTADHPQGFGIVLARLPKTRMAEARAIVALSDLIKAAPPFAALGRLLEGQDAGHSLFAAAELDITTGDLQAMSAALDRALGPAAAFRSAGTGRAKEPKAVHKP